MATAGWYVVVLVASIFTTLLVTVATLQNRERAGAVPLAVLLGGAALWSGCDLLARLATTPAIELFFSKLLYVGVVLTVNGYIVFVLEFIGREDLLSRRTFAALAIEPGILLAMLAYDPTGGALITQTLEGGSVTTSGLLFVAHVTYSYVLVALMTGLLVRAALRTKELYRWQFGAMLVGVFAPWLGNAAYQLDYVAMDVTPLAFSVTGISLFLAIQRAGFMDIAPVARDIVVDTIDDAVVVLDDQGRFIDYNITFESLFDIEESAIGESVGTVLDCPVLEQALDESSDGEILAVETSAGQREFEVTVSPIDDRYDRRRGCVVLLHDVSEQQRRQRELQRQNEQLDQFASLISHDLRNPLNVAAGRTEIAMQTGDLSHLEDVQDAHERMGRLIEDVLELARQGQGIDEPESVDLSTVATEAWDHVDTDGAVFEIENSESIVADESRLRQVFENLYRNAVEHGSADSRPEAEIARQNEPSVTIWVGTTEDGFYVADDGPGIPADERERVFETGYTDHEEGTGFGLAIVEQIADAHGWTVRVAENADGGARFEFDGVEFGSSA